MADEDLELQLKIKLDDVEKARKEVRKLVEEIATANLKMAEVRAWKPTSKDERTKKAEMLAEMGEDVRMKRGSLIGARGKAASEVDEYKKLKTSMKESNEEVDTHTELMKKYRQALTSVLIDLHVLRILASQSKVISFQFNTMGKVLGYLTDVILMPLLPAMVSAMKLIVALANAYRILPSKLKEVIALFISIGITLFIAWRIYSWLNTTLVEFGLNLKRLNLIMAGQASPVGGKNYGTYAGAAAGLGIGLAVVQIMEQTGLLKAIYKAGKQYRKTVVEPFFGFIKSIWRTVVFIFTTIWNFLLGLPKKIWEALQAFWKWLYDTLVGIGQWIWDHLPPWLQEALKAFAGAITSLLAWLNEHFGAGSTIGKAVSGPLPAVGALPMAANAVYNWLNPGASGNTTTTNTSSVSSNPLAPMTLIFQGITDIPKLVSEINRQQKINSNRTKV